MEASEAQAVVPKHDSSSANSPSKASQRVSTKDLRNQAITLHKTGKLKEAAQLYHICLSANPNDSGSWSNLGALLRTLKQYPAAIGCYTHALELKPDDAGFLSNLGNALKDIDRLDESVACHRKAVEQAPDNDQFRLNYAVALREAKQFEQAKEQINILLAKNENNAGYEWERAVVNLYLGDYEQGWQDYEARWRTGELPLPPLSCPRWQGEALKKNDHLIVIAEQGFGDTIFAVRFIKLIKEKAKTTKLTLVCKSELYRIFTNLAVDQLITPEQLIELAKTKQTTQFTHWVPLMSLLGIFNITHNNPVPPVEIHIPTDAKDKFSWIQKKYQNKKKIGIVWSGSKTYKDNDKRQGKLEDFLKLAEQPNVQLFSLQKGPAQKDIYQHGAQTLLIDLSEQLKDFADTAAVIDQLDMIIMTDSSVVHLAGSMNKQVIDLLQDKPYWLYGAEGERLKRWYQSVQSQNKDEFDYQKLKLE